MDHKPGFFRKQNPVSFKKRSRSQFAGGKYKRSNVNHEHSLTTPKAVDTIYRLLCPVKKIGSVLGKGGTIVNALRDETHAKIRVADAIPGAEERVIIIFSYLSEESRPYNSDQDHDNDDITENESEHMKPHCPAQDALLKVHDRIAADDYGGMVDEDHEHDEVVTARLLVPNNQVGCLLGKGGNVIQKLRTDTGANIRILPAEHLPDCAMSTDELVQISGVPAVVRKALYVVSTLLHQHPRKENPPLDDIIHASTHGSTVPAPPHRDSMWSHRNSGSHLAPPMPLFGGYGNESSRFPPGRFSGGRVGEAVEEFSMKIVCAAEKIGGVIGKGGANVKQLQQQTGATIQVESTAPEAEERIIFVSSREAPWDPVSPTVQAILQLQSKTCEMSEKGIVTTRLLVSSSKVGCLLGQGGHIITEMRRRTKADIRVYSKDDKPQYASADEELVQISGSQNVARDALFEILSRLRERTLQGGGSPAVDHVRPSSFQGFAPSETFSGIELPSSGMIGAGNYVGYEHMKGFAPSETFSGRELPSSGMIGAGNYVGYEHMKGAGPKHEAQNYPMMPPTATGYSNYNSSMEVKIPNSAGMGGSNFSDIHQIPGARVKLHDPLSGASECIVEIHGSSNQTSAAQSLLHAFVASGEQNLASGGQNFQPPPGLRPY